MRVWPSLHIRSDVIVRVIADAVMLNAALLLTLMLHYVWVASTSGSNLSQTLLSAEGLGNHIDSYLQSCWILTIVSLTIFGLNGFYSHGRYYQHRFKALVITRGVSLSYLSFSLVVQNHLVAHRRPAGLTPIFVPAGSYSRLSYAYANPGTCRP